MLFRSARRVAGPDFMERLLQQSVENKYTHVFYGANEQTLQKLACELECRYPGIQILAMIAPPYTKEIPQLSTDQIQQINSLDADFMWIGLGAPKQELFMHTYREKLQTIQLGVGAAFDFVSGNKKRAPRWMQKLGLEWLYRLLQEPRRLGRRYIVMNTKYVYWCIKELLCHDKG